VIIPLSADSTTTMQTLKQQLDANQIVILCLDMNYVRATDQPERRSEGSEPGNDPACA